MNLIVRGGGDPPLNVFYSLFYTLPIPNYNTLACVHNILWIARDSLLPTIIFFFVIKIKRKHRVVF